MKRTMRSLVADRARPLLSESVANAAIYMLSQPPNTSIKALDVVPTGMFWALPSLAIPAAFPGDALHSYTAGES